MQIANLTWDHLATVNDDYDNAVVRLVWDVHRQSGVRTLICGAVELLPKEVPPPPQGAERHTKLSRSRFLYARDIVTTASDSLEWLRRCKSGQAIRPTNTNGKIDLDAATPPLFNVAPFDDEPPSPWLITSRKAFPYLATWHVQPRVRHYLPRIDWPKESWTEQERATATNWTKVETGFDFASNGAYWGSLHLIAPNPVFRNLRLGLHNPPDGRICTLTFALTMREGRKARGLTLTLKGKRPTGLGFWICVPLEKETVQINVKHPVDSFSAQVTDATRGALYVERQSHILTSMSGILETSSSTRIVEAPALPRGQPVKYETPITGHYDVPLETGDRHEPPAALRKLRIAARAAKRRERGLKAQRWYRNQAETAVAGLRDLVRTARGRLHVYDPYFGGDDLIRVVLAVQNIAVRVRILTGAEHLRTRRPKLEPGEEGDHLLAQLETAQRGLISNHIEIRVMGGGESPPFHDRFLLAGDKLWMLGSSLNAFGQRGTLRVLVPDPDPVLEDLERIWLAPDPNTIELTEWVRRRRLSREP